MSAINTEMRSGSTGKYSKREGRHAVKQQQFPAYLELKKEVAGQASLTKEEGRVSCHA